MQARNADALRCRWRARDASCSHFFRVQTTMDHGKYVQFTSRAAADPCARDVMNDAADAGCTFLQRCECACLFGHRRSRHLAACNTLASRVVFARPGCYVVVQGVVSGFLKGRWLLPFSSSKKAGSHNLSIYPCVLTCVGSNPPESSGDSHLTLSPMLQAKTARCAAIGAPWAAYSSHSAL